MKSDRSLPVLSIRQPWAWLIVNGYKDIENRVWNTNYRGEFLIHASTNYTLKEFEEARNIVVEVAKKLWIAPDRCELNRGGIVGKATIVDCATKSDSPWFKGPYGFKLEDAKPLPFLACKGRQRWFYHT